MKYWAYPTYGTGSVSYVDDNYGNINANFSAEINWNGMSNTLVFNATTRFIANCGAAVYTDYEVDFSSSTINNIRNAMINHFSYDSGIMLRSRESVTNFYWKSLIRGELDLNRPVIYTITRANGDEIAFIVDGYDDNGLFHINWSNATIADGWVELNELSYDGEAITIANQQMLTGIRPSLGPLNIDENFETDFSHFNWQFSGNANWTISTEAAYYGSKSAKSGNITDNQSTSLYITINVTEPDTISFYKKVSCEYEANSLYDRLAFFIDGVEQNRWSGNGSWAFHQYMVPAGVHEFRWTYLKDGATDYYSDCAWIDAINLPEGTTPLSPPRFVEAQVMNGSNVLLNWVAPEGINPTLLGYKVYRNGVEVAQFSNPLMNSYTDAHLPNGNYTYYLRSYYTEGLSSPSSEVSATIEVPYAPTNLTASLNGISTVELNWTAPPAIRDRALMGYYIYRDNVQVAQVESPEVTTYEDSGLAEGVYYYKVAAVYSAALSAFSNTVQIAVGVAEPPSNLTAVVNGDDVTLTWQQVSDTSSLVGFRVFRSGVMIAEISSPTQLSYIDSNLPNATYSYYIRAVYSDIESPNSATVNVTVEVRYPPTGVTATVANGVNVQVRWLNPQVTRALTNYLVYRNGQIIAAVYSPGLSYLDQNLPNGVYTYNISAVYSGIESPQSSTVTATIEVLYPPTALTATVTLAEVHLNWTVPVNSGGLNRSFLGYKVYRNTQLIGTINNVNTHVYTDPALPNGTYSYAVSAVYSAGESSQATTGSVIIEILYPPTNLQANANGGNIALTWTAAATEPSGREISSRAFTTYKVYRDNVLIGQPNTTNFADVVTVNGNYVYYVTAQYDSGESEHSNNVQVFVEIPYPPTALIANVVADDVNLTWSAPANRDSQRALIAYQVFRNNILINSVTATNYTDSDLANGQYDYFVKAVYENSISIPSSTVTAIVEVLYPALNLQYSVSNRNNVALAWSAPLQSGGLRNLSGYEIYRNNSYLNTTVDLSYNDLALADGTYSYQIVAIYNSGSAAAGNSVVASIEYPYPPSTVSSVVNGSAVTVSWSIVPGTNVSYMLYRDSVLLTTTTNLSFTDLNLNNGSYTYYIISANASDSGISDASASTTAVVNVPYPPRNLQASVTGNAVALTWLAPVTGNRVVQSYKIWRNGSQIGTSNTLNYNDSGLSNGNYDYYITAVYESAESIPSNTVVATVEVLYPAGNFTYILNGNNVNLSWTAATSRSGERSFTGYRVYRNGFQIAMVNDLFYHDLNLANGNYSYYVIAAYGSGNSTPTNTISFEIEILYPANNLSYTVNGSNVVLNWTASASRAFIGYTIYRDNVQINEVTGVSYTDTNLANGAYSYYVVARYQGGQSTPTNTVNVQIETLYPATGLVAIVTGDDVSLTWTAAATSGGLRSLIGYKVYRDGALLNQVTTTNYSEMNLANGLYQYSIVATYSSGDAMPTPAVAALVEVLYPASGLTFAVNSNAVTLNWTAAPTSTRAFIGYNIYRNNSLYTQTADLTYTDTALANGVYTYYIKALYGSGESNASNSVTATIEVLYPATGLTANVNGDDVSLAWTAAVTSGGLRTFTAYKIYRNGAFIAQTTDLFYNDLNLTNGSYNYQVSALYSSGESTLTAVTSALVEVLYPATLLTYSVNADNVQLNWTAAVTSGGLRSFIGYKVYRNGIELSQVSGLSYMDNGLANGVYQYYVVAAYGSGNSTPTNTVSATIEILYPATNLTYVTNDDNVTVSWNAAPTSGSRSFIGYKVYRNGTEITEVTTLSYTDQDLANGPYQYYVTAHYSSGESIPTNTISLYLEVLYPATGLVANVTGDDVSLSWTAAATSGGLRSLIGYKVYRDGIMLNQVTATNYSDMNLSNGLYQYSVVATYSSGDAMPTPAVAALVEVLYPASGLTFAVNSNAVTLNWTAAPTSTRAFIGYNIYRNNSLYTQTADLTYTDTALANGVYTYYIKALYGSGESNASNSVTATIEVLYPATGLTANVNGDDVSLAWTAAVTSGGLRTFTAYKIYRNGAFIAQTTDLFYNDLNLTNGSYNYQVSALYSSGESTLTAVTSALVEVLYPATLLTYSVNADNVQLNWTAAVTSGGLRSFIGYKVYRNGIELSQVSGLSYMDNGLANGVYQYYVVAAYGSGNSTPTNTVSATIEVLYPATNLTYVTNDDNVTVSWNAAPTSYSRSFIGYKVYRNGTEITEVTTLSYTDQDLANGPYQYYVTAHYSSGESIPTNTISLYLEVLYPATGLVANVTGDDVSLSWTAAATSGGLRSLIGYKVYRDGIMLNQVTATNYSDMNLANGLYQYSVVATYSSGDAMTTPAVAALVEVLYPASGLTFAVNSNAVTLNWTAAPTSTRAFIGYNIYRNNSLYTQTTDLTYTDTALANGVYTYYIKALYGSGESNASNSVTATIEVLYPATGLTANVNGDDVSLAWTAAVTSGGLRTFTAYKIYRNGAVIAQTTDLFYNDLNLTNGSYNYQVSALYSSGESTLTAVAGVLVEVLYPATLLTYNVNADNVQLNWTAAATSGGLRSFIGYKVYRNGTELSQVSGTAYLDSGLSNSVYQYYIVAVYSAGVSTPSNTVSATVEVLYPPSGLTVGVIGDDVSLSWVAAPNTSRSLLGYNVYRNGVEIAQVDGLVYDDMNLNNGMYQYTIRSRYTSGESVDSSPVSIEIDIPYGVALLSSSVLEDAVTLHWNLPPVGTTRAFQGYFIYRNNSLYQVLNVASATSWTDYGLANGTYNYWLVAVYDAGLSIASNTVEAVVYVMPDLNPPTALSVFIVNDRFVTLDWTAPVGNVLSYKVYRNNVELASPVANTFYDPNLPNGSYNYYVKALYAEGLSSASNTVTANIMIAAPPTNFVATVQNDNDVSMSWTAPNNNETAFIVYRNGLELAYLSDVLTPSYMDMDLPNGTYHYSVVAVYQTLISAASTVQTVVINQTFSPTNVQIAVVQNEVTLSWNAPVNLDQFVGYNVYRNGTNYAQTSGLSFVDADLANGTYQYYVTTVYLTGESAPSSTRVANIRVAYAPSNLTGTSTDTNVYLGWTASADLGGFIAYQIWRNGTHIVDVNTTTYMDVNLPNGPQTYYVVAVYSFGASSPSNSATINVVSAYSPQTAVATATNHNVIIQWTPPLFPANLTGYRLYKNDALLLETTALSYSDNGLLNGDYHYKVSALYGAMESAANDAGIIHLETLYPPTNANIVVTGNTANLTWNAVQDAGFFQHYKVYRNNNLVTTTTDLNYTNVNLANGSYGYQISAQYIGGESALTNLLVAQVQLPYPPQNLNYMVAGNNVTLYWNAPQDLSGFSGYRIYRNAEIIAQLSTTNYTDNNLPNANYQYRVTALYGATESANTAMVELSIAIKYPVTNVIAMMNTSTDIATINWTAAPGGPTLTGYDVYFLIDGEQTTPNSWISVASNINASSVNDAIHGSLSTGYFVWAVVAVYQSGASEAAFSNVVHAVSNEDLTGTFATKLLGNYPNPFNPETQIVFSLKEKMPVKLLVYNVKGQLVNTLVNDRMNAGEHRIVWKGNDSNGKTLSSGVYFYHLITPNYNKVGKTLLAK
jgi:hypothetical protein